MVSVKIAGKVRDNCAAALGHTALCPHSLQHYLEHGDGRVTENTVIAGNDLAHGQLKHHAVEFLFADDIPAVRTEPAGVKAVKHSLCAVSSGVSPSSPPPDMNCQKP